MGRIIRNMVAAARAMRHAAGGVMLLGSLGCGGAVQAQAMREVRALPGDCRSLLPSTRRDAIQPWQAFVAMEHCDRIKRLMRLSAMLPPAEQPRFFEGLVPADRLPAGFGADIPVLRVVFPERTFFDTGQAALRPEVEPVLAIIAESLRNEPPDVALFVAGHADARGNRPLNEALSIDRADALARRIVQAGVNLSSIWRLGFGSDMPLVSGNDAYAWDRNRRIEFLFAAKPDAVATWLADQQLDGLCQAQTAQEVAQCRAHLNLKHDYEAVEVRQASPIRVEPRNAPRHDLGAGRRERRTTVALPAAAPAALSPDSHRTSLVDLNPGGERRWRIDPISRQSKPVHLDL